LLYKESTSKLANLLIDCGNSPVSKFIKSSIDCKVVALLISVGIDPDNLLNEIFKTLRTFKSPIDGGIDPEILFLNKFKEVRNFKSEIEAGRLPERLLLDKSIATTLSFKIVTPYHEATGEFKFHLEVQFSPLVALFKSTSAFFSETEISANDANENNKKVSIVIFDFIFFLFEVVK
jgi:hypothetical protein